jgi:cytochrome c-type biogenesis protein CcmH/NrfG
MSYTVILACFSSLIMFLLAGYLININNENADVNVGKGQDQPLEKRISSLTAYLKNNPSDGPSLKRLGQLYSEAGRLTEAVSAYVAAAEVLPKDPEIRRAFIELQAMGHAAGNER